MKNSSGQTNQTKSRNKLVNRIVGVVLLIAAAFIGFEVFGEAVAVVVVTLPSSPEQHQTGLDFAANDPSVQTWVGAYYMLSPSDSDPQQAIAHYKEALRLDPMYYRYWGELGSAYEIAGNLDLAETSFRNMVALAPANERSHWLLANCLLRRGEVQESLSEFKRYLEINPQACTYIYELLSKAQGITINDIDQSVVPAGGMARARFAIFAAGQRNPELAVQIWHHMSSDDLDSQKPFAVQLINAFLYLKLYDEAKSVWSIYDPDKAEASQLLLNGSFENNLTGYLSGFGWQSQQSLNGNIMVTSREAHTGKDALKIDLSGENSRDAATLMQLVAPIPGGRYSLSYFAKGTKFISSRQPLIQILNESGQPVVTDQPPAGDYNWTRRQVEFTLQSPKQAIVIVIQTPAIASFDTQGSGQVLLDDFTIEKQN